MLQGETLPPEKGFVGSADRHHGKARYGHILLSGHKYKYPARYTHTLVYRGDGLLPNKSALFWRRRSFPPRYQPSAQRLSWGHSAQLSIDVAAAGGSRKRTRQEARQGACSVEALPRGSDSTTVRQRIRPSEKWGVRNADLEPCLSGHTWGY